MKKITVSFITAFVFIINIAPSVSTTPKENAPKEGKVNVINSEYSFIYNFPEKPKLGTYVLKVNLFKNNEKVKDLTVLASYSMPSCSYHSSGKLAVMQLNKKNDYLIPMNFVMRGIWGVTLIFQRNGKNLHSTTFLIEI